MKRLLLDISLLAAVIVGVLVSTAADARIRLTFLDGNDSFSFHAQENDATFRSTTESLRFEIWNAAGLIYAVDVPIGTCVGASTAPSCTYRNREAKKARSGLAYVKIRYQTESHANKIWLQSYGDLSSATDPVMSIKLYQNGALYDQLVDEVFTATRTGWIGLL
jgi:hypothetical protein